MDDESSSEEFEILAVGVDNSASAAGNVNSEPAVGDGNSASAAGNVNSKPAAGVDNSASADVDNNPKTDGHKKQIVRLKGPLKDLERKKLLKEEKLRCDAAWEQVKKFNNLRPWNEDEGEDSLEMKAAAAKRGIDSRTKIDSLENRIAKTTLKRNRRNPEARIRRVLVKKRKRNCWEMEERRRCRGIQEVKEDGESDQSDSGILTCDSDDYSFGDLARARRVARARRIDKEEEDFFNVFQQAEEDLLSGVSISEKSPMFPEVENPIPAWNMDEVSSFVYEDADITGKSYFSSDEEREVKKENL